MNVVKRLKEPTPKFFKKLIMLGATLTGISATLLTVEAQVPGFILPEILHTAAQYLAVAGLLMASISKVTVYEEPDNKQIRE